MGLDKIWLRREKNTDKNGKGLVPHWIPPERNEGGLYYEMNATRLAFI